MENQSTKSFWSRPEGKTGMIFLALLLGGGAYGASMLLPFIITLMENTITAVALLAVLAGILYVAMDHRVHTLVAYFYRGSMRKVTQVLIELDPINILKSYVEDLKARRTEMNEQVGKVKGQMVKSKVIIEKNEAERINCLKLAEQAKIKGPVDAVIVNTRQAGRLEKANETLNSLYVKMEMLYRVLAKMYDSSGFLIQDIEGEVQVQIIQRDAVMAGHNAMKSAMKIIQGDTDKKMLFDQTMDYLVDDYGAKVGEMERFMEVSSNFINGVDLQNGVFQEDGMKMLEKWEKEPSLVLKDQKTILIAKAKDSNEVLDLAAPISVGTKKSENKYKSILE